MTLLLVLEIERNAIHFADGNTSEAEYTMKSRIMIATDIIDKVPGQFSDV